MPGSARAATVGPIFVAAVCLALISSACSVSTELAVSPIETSDTSTSEIEATGARFELVEGELPITEERLIGFIEFVESTTGRTFQTPPRIAVQSVEDFEAGLAPTPDDLAEAEASADIDARYLQALGQTTLGPDELLDVVLQSLSSADLILGYFDPDEDTLYVPADGDVDGQFESVLVHELVHALDHQYVDLSALLEAAETADLERTEGSFQILAVAEGRASAVQHQWMDDNDVERETDVDLEPFADVPPSVLLSIALPYELGEQMIDQLGGVDDTWYLYADLPQSSEQAMFPERLNHDEPITLAIPTADGQALDQGVFGADAMLLWLVGHSLEPDQNDVISGLIAIDGWGGGAWVLWGDERQSCLRAHATGDTQRDLDEMASAFEDWELGAVGRGVETGVDVGDDVLEVTACAPYVS